MHAVSKYRFAFRLFQILFLVVGLAMFTTVIPEAMILVGTRSDPFLIPSSNESLCEEKMSGVGT